VHVDRLKAAYGDKPIEPWYEPTATRRQWTQEMKHVNEVPHIVNELPTIPSNVPQDDFIDPVEEIPVSIPLNVNTPVPKFFKPSIPDEDSHIASPTVVTDASDLPGLSELPDLPPSEDTDISTAVPLSIVPTSPTHSEPTDIDTDTDLEDAPPITESTSSVQGRTQSWGGGDVNPEMVQEVRSAQDHHVSTRDIQSESKDNTLEQLEIPLDLVIRLKKSKQQKRKFVPNTSKSKRRKKPKN
jgi:hypothetical protein